MIRPKKSWDHWLPDPQTLNDNDVRRREATMSRTESAFDRALSESTATKVSEAYDEVRNLDNHFSDLEASVNDNATLADQFRDIAMYALGYFKAFAVEADDKHIAVITAWCDKHLYKEWRWFKVGSRNDYVFIIHDDAEQVHFKLRWS